MPDDRPDFGQALADSGWSDSGGMSDATPDTPTADASASGSSPDAPPAAGQPAADPTVPPEPEASPSTPGPIPFDRHEAILAKARKDHEDALRAAEERFAWARDIPPDKYAEVADFVMRAKGNPVEFVMSYADALLQNPEHAAALRSYAARTLGTRQQQAAAEAAQQPSAGPDLGPVLEIDGIPLPTKAQRDAQEQDLIRRVVDAVTQEVGGRIAPVETVAKALQQAKEQQAAQEASATRAKAVIADAKTWPGYAEHEKALAEALGPEMASGRWADEQVGDALRHLYITRIVPQLLQAKAGDVVRDLRTQALTGPSPTSAKPTMTPNGTRPTWANVFQTV